MSGSSINWANKLPNGFPEEELDPAWDGMTFLPGHTIMSGGNFRVKYTLSKQDPSGTWTALRHDGNRENSVRLVATQQLLELGYRVVKESFRVPDFDEVYPLRAGYEHWCPGISIKSPTGMQYLLDCTSNHLWNAWKLHIDESVFHTLIYAQKVRGEGYEILSFPKLGMGASLGTEVLITRSDDPMTIGKLGKVHAFDGKNIWVYIYELNRAYRFSPYCLTPRMSDELKRRQEQARQDTSVGNEENNQQVDWRAIAAEWCPETVIHKENTGHMFLLEKDPNAHWIALPVNEHSIATSLNLVHLMPDKDLVEAGYRTFGAQPIVRAEDVCLHVARTRKELDRDKLTVDAAANLSTEMNAEFTRKCFVQMGKKWNDRSSDFASCLNLYLTAHLSGKMDRDPCRVCRALIDRSVTLGKKVEHDRQFTHSATALRNHNEAVNECRKLRDGELEDWFRRTGFIY